MAFTSSSSTSSSGPDSEVAPCSKACSKAYATLQSHYDKFTNDLRKSQFDVISYKIGLEFIEARLIVYQQNENVFEKDIKILKLDVMLRDNALVELRKKFKTAEKERDELKLKLENFQTSLKNLSKLLASQITDKTGLGYDNKVFNSIVFDCDELISSEPEVSVPTSPVYDRYKSGEGYHAVRPPYTENFMPPKPDLIFHDAPTVSETIPNVINVEPSTTKPTKNMSHSNSPSAPIIEDWVSDLEDESEVEHPTPAEHLRKDIPKSRGHRHRWNRKACFVCKSLTHLIKDCDYNEKKMVQKHVRNHAMRGNHQHYARMTHPHTNRHVVPTVVLTRSRLVPLTAARHVTTAVPQTNVQLKRPAKHGVNKAHSPIRRPINHRPSLKNSNFHQKFTTVKANQVNVVQGVKGNRMHLADLNNGCSRHMTGNISYLTDFEELTGGYVAFGGNPEGGKITGKGIKREFSVARTPQQNGIAERKNRTLIEAARNMLADLLLPIPFWAEAVNTACYVQNRVLVTKPHNKTPYELLLGSRPTWLFDIDTLTQSMNYQPVAARNQPNHNAGIQENINAGTDVKETTSVQQYMFLPLWSTGSKDPQNTDADATFDNKELKFEVYVSLSSSDKPKKHNEKAKREAKGKSHVKLSTRVRDLSDEFEEFYVNNTNRVNAASTPVTTVELNSTNSTNSFSAAGPSNTAVSLNFKIGGKSSFVDPSQYPDDPNVSALKDITYSDAKEDVGAEVL
nr:putative ribonuclease H-like domain-containing protein [Tanacetum cinerariifolium]